MLCALTHKKDFILATFLKNESGVPDMYLHINPLLNLDDSNVDINDIDYSTVVKEFGAFVNKEGFFHIAGCVWSSIGGFELSTKELEQRVPGIINNFDDNFLDAAENNNVNVMDENAESNSDRSHTTSDYNSESDEANKSPSDAEDHEHDETSSQELRDKAARFLEQRNIGPYVSLVTFDESF